MLPETTHNLTITDVLHLIEEARNAELCRDIDSLRKILQIVWNDDNCLPTFAEYEPTIRAELLRLYGFFLTSYGWGSQKLKNYQSEGKDLLTNAVEIFQSEGLTDKAAEANVILAFCYWNSGEISECEAILSSVESEFGENQFHPVFLQIRLNRLMIHYWKQEFNEGIKLIEKISVPMSLCKDLRLKTMFHNQAGLIYTKTHLFDDSAFHFSEAIRFARKSNNLRFIAINYNNLSLLYCDTKKFNDAHSSVAKSIKILTEINYCGLLPHALDTKALIYIDENKFSEALKTIEEALKHFYQGDDYNGLTAALWTKVRCLIRLERSEDALVTYGELHRIAAKQIGEAAVRKFARSFTEEVYLLRHLPFTDEVAEFKKARVSAALIEANGKVSEAAKILRLKNHQALSDILNKQFPELLGELGFRRRARRTAERKSKTINISFNEILQEREISRLILTGKNFSFDFNVEAEQFETYYFDKYLMKSFGIESGAIVAVVPVEEIKTGMIVLISDENGFAVGRTEYEGWGEIYFISDESGNPIPINEKNVIGEPIGFCLFSEADKKYIQFSRLS
jgi:tetratricopeptide (TPR) repeat protein